MIGSRTDPGVGIATQPTLLQLVQQSSQPAEQPASAFSGGGLRALAATTICAKAECVRGVLGSHIITSARSDIALVRHTEPSWFRADAVTRPLRGTRRVPPRRHRAKPGPARAALPLQGRPARDRPINDAVRMNQGRRSSRRPGCLRFSGQIPWRKHQHRELPRGRAIKAVVRIAPIAGPATKGAGGKKPGGWRTRTC